MSAPPSHLRPQVVLLASVFAVAACGLVYELILGAVSSYLLGDAVTQFSLVIGVFLCAMGLGSYLAKFVHRRLLATFVEVEIWIGLAGGLSSILLFAVNAFAGELFSVIFYSLCAGLGALVGIEIPLLIRILDARRAADRKEGREEGREAPASRSASGGESSDGESGVRQGMSEAVSHVLALDYLGALAGSLLFPFLALPFLGLSRTSVVFGLMNLGVAAAGLTLVEGRRRGMALRLAAAGLLLLAAFTASGRLVGFLEDLLYQDSVILARDTPYQRIVITRWKNDVRLFLNGHLQLSSIDEARYHEALVVPAMEAAVRPRQVLILGGGDGLAARTVLTYPTVERVTVVDIDPVMTELARSRPELVALNQGSLSSSRTRVINQDALLFLQRDEGFYDVILADLPDPSTPPLAKLYSRAFYTLAARRLAAGGLLVTQATSPFFAPEAFWCIAATVEAAGAAPEGTELPGLTVLPYHVQVPSFGEWGFVLAARHPVRPETLGVSIPTHYLTRELLPTLFIFGKDTARRPVEVNRLDDPVLHRYYQQGWQRYNE